MIVWALNLYPTWMVNLLRCRLYVGPSDSYKIFEIINLIVHESSISFFCAILASEWHGCASDWRVVVMRITIIAPVQGRCCDAAARVWNYTEGSKWLGSICASVILWPCSQRMQSFCSTTHVHKRMLCYRNLINFSHRSCQSARVSAFLIITLFSFHTQENIKVYHQIDLNSASAEIFGVMIILSDIFCFSTSKFSKVLKNREIYEFVSTPDRCCRICRAFFWGTDLLS